MLAAEQTVDIGTALASITIDAAHHIRAEGRLGSLTPGKYADFVLLDRDPRKTPSDDLRSIKIRGTWSDGRAVWAS